MRVVPVLFPTDLGRCRDGLRPETGLRGAPDVLLDLLEDHGVRFGRPRPLAVPVPSEPDSGALPFDALHVAAAEGLAAAVAEINGQGDFPLVLGGDHSVLFGHLLGHARRHPEGFGLAVLADPQLDLHEPGTGEAFRMGLSAGLRRLPEDTQLARLMSGCTLDREQITVAGVRGPDAGRAEALAARVGIDVWTMERLEMDGEQAYRSALERNLARGPVALSIDARGLDPHLMTAVNDPVPDGLDWSFLRRSLEQCLPHVDRILGLDLCEVDPTRDEGHGLSQVRFAETVAPFLRKISR